MVPCIEVFQISRLGLQPRLQQFTKFCLFKCQWIQMERTQSKKLKRQHFYQPICPQILKLSLVPKISISAKSMSLWEWLI